MLGLSVFRVLYTECILVLSQYDVNLFFGRKVPLVNRPITHIDFDGDLRILNPKVITCQLNFQKFK